METTSTSGRGQACSTRCNIGRRGWRMTPARVVRQRAADEVPIGSLYPEHPPVPREQPTVIPGVKTKPTPILNPGQLITRLQTTLGLYPKKYFGAFYSSIVGGIVTDAALALIPIDDQYVTKGHGVAEVVILRDGHLYMLDEHIQRLHEQCDAIGIEPPFTAPYLKRLLVDTAAASGFMNGQLRFWVTAGRGGFSPVQTGSSEACLYALCLGDTFEIDRTKPWGAVVAELPIYPTEVSQISSNQQLLLSVNQLRAKEQEESLTIFTDEEGFVQNCIGYTLCIMTHTDVLIIPPFDNVTPSIMLQRMLEMYPEERKRSPHDVVIKDMVQRKLHISEVQAAKEAFIVCTPYVVAPVRRINGEPIADHEGGVTTLALHYMLDNDIDPPPRGVFSPRHTPVPYGYMTGMRSQLQ